MVGEYANKAQINPGIIYGCISSSIVFNAIFAHFLFKQHLTSKQMVGIGVIIIGVVWISVAKNTGIGEEAIEGIDEDELFKNRVLGITTAILAAFVSSLRPVQAKIVKE